jgi:hypothetical protein
MHKELHSRKLLRIGCKNGKGKLVTCSIMHQIMKTYVGVKPYHQHFSLQHQIGVSGFGAGSIPEPGSSLWTREESIVPGLNESPVVQPVACHHTN